MSTFFTVSKIKNYFWSLVHLKIVLQNLRQQFPNKKILIVFGCGGDRDKKKRSLMGKIANSYCDEIYLTDDNPRNENPNLIRKEIKKGIRTKKIFEMKESDFVNKNVSQ